MFPRIQFSDFLRKARVDYSRLGGRMGKVTWARWGSSYPASLALLWPSKLTDAGILKSAKGPAPTYTDTPTLSAGGVVPGDGPSFDDVVTWSDGGTIVVSFTATTASADLVGDVQVFGPVYAYSGGLKAKPAATIAQLLTYSENFGKDIWAKGNLTAAIAEGAPVFTSSSYLITSTSTSGVWLQMLSGLNIKTATKYTASIYAKKSIGFLQITFPSATFGASQYANFNLDTGVLGTVLGGTAKITSVGEGWYRCEFTATSTAANASGAGPAFTLVELATSTRLAGKSGLSAYVAGANLTESDGATAYSLANGGASTSPPSAQSRQVSWQIGDRVVASLVANVFWRVAAFWTYIVPQESAEGVATVRAADGALMYATNPTYTANGSSMTKMMTGILADRYITDYDATITVASDDLAGGDSGTTYLGVGDVATIRDILHCTLIHSDNVGAMVVARVVGAIINPDATTTAQKVSAFISEMNDVAGEIGSGAVYTNPWAGVVASAIDQCIVMRHIYDSCPVALSISGKATYGVTITGANERTFSISHTLPVSSFPEFVAGKTGTGDSKGSVCMLWDLDGVKYITTILRSDPYGERYNDLRTILEYQYSLDGKSYGAPVADSTMPPLELSPTAPGDLRSVQCWGKVATAKEIGKY